MPELRLAVVGATGAVGPVVLEVLAERGFPAAEIGLFASARSAGSVIRHGGRDLVVQELTEDSLAGYDLALFSAGGSISRKYAPEAVRRGCVVVDKSNAFRMDPAVPLVVPEVNPDAVATHSGIVSNPNCSTIQLVAALKPLHDLAGLAHVTIATYQAVSGTGADAVDELREQSGAVLRGDDVTPRVYPHQIAFNVLPHCETFEGDETTEELKLVHETHKILGDDSIGISATCVRVPVWRGHSEAVWVETREPLTAADARRALAAAPGVDVVDDPDANAYPLPSAATGSDRVLVGRIRRDGSRRNGLAFWVVADNLRKGAATNGVQIAELLVERDLVHVPRQEAAAS
ncbi:MAG TPA: aspartate-semialdehyde dehydrogenase [Thermoleophilia bacterium]|nr:aspartate-semialdehyde dehydrogenase [Thermoleophilia bacterium]